MDLQFTNNWFQITAKAVWDQLIPQVRPKKILEIGSYEGASVCYLIDKLAKDGELEIHCIDSWEGGIEHISAGISMNAIETRFRSNIGLAVERAAKPVDMHIHKGFSDFCLARLVAEDKTNYFDMIYIDGSHQAADVLYDAVVAFKLLKVDGLMVFDDYLWAETMPYGKDPLRCPKPAIDAFVNINFRKLQVVSAPLSQLYVRKISD